MKKFISVGALTFAMALLLVACTPSGGGMTPSTAPMPTAPMPTSPVPTAPMPTTGITMDKKENTMMAPDFQLQDLAGNTVKLSDFSGENVYIKYWASWCPICLSGLEEINTLSGEDIDFKVLTIVSPDHKGEKGTEDFKAWFSGVENTQNITVLLDEGGTYTTGAGVRGYPTSEWIGADGSILSVAPGHMDNDKIKAGFLEMN